MNSRITALRLALGGGKKKISQKQFGEKLGISDAYVAQLEGGKPLNDRIINLICLTYGVNEHWFRTGEGEMFAAPNVDESDVETYRRVLKARIHALPPEVQNMIWDYATEIRDACHPRPGEYQEQEGGKNRPSSGGEDLENRRVA